MAFYNYLIELLDDGGAGGDGDDGDDGGNGGAGGDNYKIAYSGATSRGAVRAVEHLNLVGGAGRVAASVAKHGPARHRVRIVAKTKVDRAEDDKKLPFPIRCLETYLMKKHNTTVPRASKLRDLFAHENKDHGHWHPDISLPGQPMNFQLNSIRSVSQQHAEAVDEAGKAFENPTTTLCIYTKEEQEEIYQQIFDELGVEPLETVLVACSKPKDVDSKRVIFDIDSPFMKARELRVRYEEMNGWETVSRDAVFGEMMEVQTLDPANEDLAEYFKNLKKAFHSDKHVSLGIPMTAREALGVFTMIESWTGAFEEAALMKKAKAAKEAKEAKAHVTTAVKWRDWMRQNEGATPSPHPTGGSLKTLEEKRTERTLGKAMHNWRAGEKRIGKGHGHPPQEARNTYLVILRDFPSFAQLCYGKAEKSHTNITKANALLRTGHGTEAARKKFPTLVNFPSNCPACRVHRPEYKMLCGYLKGQNDTNEAVLLDGVDPEYAAWLHDTHASNVDDWKAKKAKFNKKHEAARHASGLVKKRPREDEQDDEQEEDGDSEQEEDGEQEDDKQD